MHIFIPVPTHRTCKRRETKRAMLINLRGRAPNYSPANTAQLLSNDTGGRLKREEPTETESNARSPAGGVGGAVPRPAAGSPHRRPGAASRRQSSRRSAYHEQREALQLGAAALAGDEHAGRGAEGASVSLASPPRAASAGR